MKTKYFYIFIFLYASLIYSQTDEQIELDDISFVGNNSISTSELKSVILSKESPNWFSQFLNKFTSFGDKAVYFDSLLIKNDLAAIKSLYQSKGFFKTSVKAGYKIDSSASSAELIYYINEGAPALFNSFIINGLDNLPGEYKER